MNTGNDSQDPQGCPFDEEGTIILKDFRGNYYLIPSKHMSKNMVKPAFNESIEKLIPTGGCDSIQVIGVYDISKSLRRNWTPPVLEEVDFGPVQPTS